MDLQWQGIIATSSVLSLFLVALWILEKRVPPVSTARGKMTFGVLLGATGILGMSMAPNILPGFTFDLRHAFVSASGLFGGPLSAMFTALAASIFRIHLGGEGAIPGVFGIFISAAIGSIGYFLIPSDRRNVTKLLIFSVCVTAGVLASFFAIEASLRYSLLQTIGAPVLTLTFATTLVTTLLVNMEMLRRETNKLNNIYAATVRELPDCLNAKDLNGHFIVANEATARLMRASNADELIGRSDYDYYPQEVAKQYREDELAVIRSGQPSIIEQHVIFHNGEEGWLSTVKVPLRSAEGQIIGIITHNRDVTELRSLRNRPFRGNSTIKAWAV